MSHRVGIQIFWRYGIPNYKYTLHAHNYMYERERGSSNTHTHTVSHTDTYTYVCRYCMGRYTLYGCAFFCVYFLSMNYNHHHYLYYCQHQKVRARWTIYRRAKQKKKTTANDEEATSTTIAGCKEQSINDNNKSMHAMLRATTRHKHTHTPIHRCLRRSQLRPKKQINGRTAVCVVKEHTSKGKYNNRCSDDSHYRLRVRLYYRADVIPLCAMNPRLRIWWDREIESIIAVGRLSRWWW